MGTSHPFYDRELGTSNLEAQLGTITKYHMSSDPINRDPPFGYASSSEGRVLECLDNLPYRSKIFWFSPEWRRRLREFSFGLLIPSEAEMMGMDVPLSSFARVTNPGWTGAEERPRQERYWRPNTEGVQLAQGLMGSNGGTTATDRITPIHNARLNMDGVSEVGSVADLQSIFDPPFASSTADPHEKFESSTDLNGELAEPTADNGVDDLPMVDAGAQYSYPSLVTEDSDADLEKGCQFPSPQDPAEFQAASLE